MKRKFEIFWQKNAGIIKLILLTTLICGLFAHGFMFFNKISYHDDAFNYYGIGVTVSSGRWMLYVMRFLMVTLFGESLFSIPVFNGFVSLALLAVISFVVIKMLNITKKVSVVILCGCFIVFPQISSMFFYMYTAPFYLIGTLMGICGVYLLQKKNIKVWDYIWAIVLMACSVGTYQANIAIILALMVLQLLKYEVVFDPDQSDKFIKNCVIRIGVSIAFLVVYLGIEKVFLLLRSESLSDYQNINTYGMTSLTGYFERIVTSYKEFFWPTKYTVRDMYPLAANTLYKLLILVYVAMIILPLFDKTRNIKNRVQITFLLLVFPLACSFIFVMCDTQSIHAVMMYGSAMFFPCLLMLLEHYTFQVQSKLISCGRIQKFSAVVLVFLIIVYCRYSNICYLKAEMVQSQFVNYANNLVGRIEATEDYVPGMKVAYIGEYKKQWIDTHFEEPFMYVTTQPYFMDSVINDYAWRETMSVWCGFTPFVIQDTSELEAMQEVADMPVYPAEGSIKIIDDILVVKFAEKEK